MLRVRPPTAWLLRLLVLLQAVPPVLPKQQPPLIVKLSPLHGVPVPYSSFPLRLPKSTTAHPAARADAVAAYVLKPRASTLATDLLQICKKTELKILDILDIHPHQTVFCCFLGLQPFFELVCPRTAGQHIATPQAPPPRLHSGARCFAACSNSCSPALLKLTCNLEHRRTVVRIGWGCCRWGVLLRPPPHAVLRAHEILAHICARASSTGLTLVRPPIVVFRNVRTTQHLPVAPYAPVGCALGVTSTFMRCHETRNQQVCCFRLSPGSRCTPPLVKSSCKASRQVLCLIRSANPKCSFKTWRSQRPNIWCCDHSRSLAASFLRRPNSITCFIASGGKPINVAAAAPASATRASPTNISTRRTTMTAVTRYSATGRRGQSSAAGTNFYLFVSCREGRFVVRLSKRAKAAMSPIAVDAASSQGAALGAFIVGTMLSAMKTATPDLPARIPQTISSEAPSAPQPYRTRLYSALPSTTSSSNTGSYPFNSIEKKWARYYAEHPGDYSPSLPQSDPILGEPVSIAKIPPFCAPVQDPASETSITAASPPIAAVPADSAGSVPTTKLLFESCRESAVDVPMADEIQRDLKQTTKPAGTQQEKEDATSSAASSASPALSTQQVKKRNKFYILSMIPYPSGEGLHVGHCLTYTVADVMARYKRLQLRGEILRDQVRSKERKAWEGIGVEGGKGDLMKQQGHHQPDQTALNPPRQSQTGCSTFEPLHPETGGAEETQYGGVNASSCSELFRRSNPEEATLRQKSVKYEESALPLSTQTVVARMLDHGRKEERVGFDSDLTRTASEASVQNKRGKESCSQAGKENQQALPTSLPQPDVMHVMGWDAFGLPAEQHALLSGNSPRLSVCKNIERFRRQLQRLGLCVDWRREINTSDPKFFRWTQWIFLQMWKRGLVYEKAANVNWCEALGEQPLDTHKSASRATSKRIYRAWWERASHSRKSCVSGLFHATLWNSFTARCTKLFQSYACTRCCYTFAHLQLLVGTVLADEEVENGVSSRGHYPVEQRCLEQWHLRITAYAEELVKSVDLLEWPEDVKTMQRNWIGRRDLFCVNLPLLISSAADENILSAREGRNPENQSAAGQARGLEPLSQINSHCDNSSACSAAMHERSLSEGDPTSFSKTVQRAQVGQVATDAVSKLRAAESADATRQTDGKFSTLRCVCVSPELLFGVTFVGLHAAHKQAHAAAVVPAARRWLARQSCQPNVAQERHAASAFHVESDDSHNMEQKSCSTTASNAEELAEAKNIKGIVRDAIEEGKGQANVGRHNHELMNASELSSTFVSRESVFSGSYLTHPLTEALLPVWLLSEKLFDQLKGAGAYFHQHDAVLVVPGHDRVAERWAGAAGVPVVQVLASSTPVASQAGIASRKTSIASPTETVGTQYKEVVHRTNAANGSLPDVLINSKSESINVNGLIRGQARQRMLEHLISRGIGERQSGFALRDWVFSRQRFWGEPIPLIRAHGVEKGNSAVFPESETNLPVVLPEAEFDCRNAFRKQCGKQASRVAQPILRSSTSPERACHQNGEGRFYEKCTSTEDYGDSCLPRTSSMTPLAHYPQWWDITHNYDIDLSGIQRLIQPACEDARAPVIEREAEKTKKPRAWVALQREVSTMPQWAGSSWYFLRFLDPHNTQEAFNKEVAQYWMPVDLYVGGKEHAVTHLLYARFWHKVLRDIGCINCAEPFKRLCTPGIILGTPGYVAFQRLDTGEWVSASSVCVKTNRNSSTCDPLGSRPNCSSITKPGNRPVVTGTKNTSQPLRPLDGQPDVHDVSCYTIESGTTTSTQLYTSGSETAHTSKNTCMASVQQNPVVGVHIPSGQPVREVVLEKEAILRVKELDAPVLKENKNIEVLCRYEKMSKSRGNVVSPDSLIDAYGADAVRLHLLFMGPIEARKVWSLGGIRGISRFLNRVWHLITSSCTTEVRALSKSTVYRTGSSTPSLSKGVHPLSSECIGGIDENDVPRGAREHATFLPTSANDSAAGACPEANQATRRPPKSYGCLQLQNTPLSDFEKTLLIQLIERVTRHVERMAFNAALAVLMCAVRKLSQWKAEGNALSVHSALVLVRLLHPFAPFVTEELWLKIHERFPNVSKCGSTPSLLASGVWPTSEDLGINACDRASEESTEARNRPTTSIGGKSESTIDIGVYLDGKLHLRVRVPAKYLNNISALEEYVKRNVQVSNILKKKRILKSIVVLKAKLVNFVTKHITCKGDEPKEMLD